MNLKKSFFLPFLSLALAASPLKAEILAQWDFNEPAGTPLTGTTSTGTMGASWSSSPGDSFTTGDGTFRIQRAIPNNQWAHAQMWDFRPVMWLVVDIEGWAFSTKEGGYNEQLHLGFSSGEAAGDVNTEIFFGRTGSAYEVSISGRAEARSQGAVWIPETYTGLGLQEDRHLRLVLKMDLSAPDPDDYYYSVYFNIDGAGYVHLGDASLDPNRVPTPGFLNYIRIRALNSFADRIDPDDPQSPTEFVDISRILLTTEDPVGTDIIDPLPKPERDPGIVMDWQFNEEAGKRLGETTDSVQGERWWAYSLNPDHHLGDSYTTGDGAFRIQRAVGSGETFNMMAYPDRLWTGKQWFVADFRGWSLIDGTPSEQVRMGFLDTHQINPTPYAVFQLRRWTEDAAPAHIDNPDPEIWYLSGQIFGASNGAQGIPDEPIFPAVQEEPVRIVLEVDEDEKTYAIYYRIGDGDYILFGESTTDPNLGPNSLYFQAVNSFAEDGEFVDVERVFLTRTNPMVPVEGGYAAWAAGHFPGGGPDSEPDANPAGDGIPNVLKYVLDLNPVVANRGGLPEPTIEQDGENAYLTLTIHRNPDADDVNLDVQVSGSLNGDSWNSGEGHTTVLEDTPSVLKVRDNTPVGAEGRRFMKASAALAQ